MKKIILPIRNRYLYLPCNKTFSIVAPSCYSNENFKHRFYNRIVSIRKRHNQFMFIHEFSTERHVSAMTENESPRRRRLRIAKSPRVHAVFPQCYVSSVSAHNTRSSSIIRFTRVRTSSCVVSRHIFTRHGHAAPVRFPTLTRQRWATMGTFIRVVFENPPTKNTEFVMTTALRVAYLTVSGVTNNNRVQSWWVKGHEPPCVQAGPRRKIVVTFCWHPIKTIS